MYPLELFPTLPDNLDRMDSRRSLPCIMALMKNTLLRGLNNIYRVANMAKMNQKHPDFTAFLEYVSCFCDMLQLHFQGDVEFFTRKNDNGVRLSKVLSPSCIPSIRDIQDTIDKFRASLMSYDRSKVLKNLQELGRTVLTQMKSQLAGLNYEKVMPLFSDDAFRSMVLANMSWFGANSDVAFLLPFIVSHHDPRTSPHWPTITPDGRKALPDLMQVHSRCWKFAPFDVVGRQPPAWQA